jgi:hypothetical protein
LNPGILLFQGLTPLATIFRPSGVKASKEEIMATSKLPPDWSLILDEIQEHLAQALEAPEPTAIPANEMLPPPEREQAWQALCERLDGLQAQAGQAETLVRQADLALEAAQLALQSHAAAGAAVQQRLAEWSARAIG